MVFTVLLFVPLALGFLLYDHEQRYQDLQEHWSARLSSMAEDRAAAVDGLIQSGLKDVSMVAQWPTVRAVSEGNPNRQQMQHLSHLLELLRESHGYVTVALLGSQNQVVASEGQLPPTTIEDLAGKQGGDSAVALLDADGQRYLCFGHRVEATARARVMLFAAPATTLYPLLQNQPVPTNTGESLLVGRVADRPEFLTPLKRGPARPEATSDPALAARRALASQESFGGFRDYRGVEVLAATRRLRTVDWAIVVKIDQSEALQEFRRHSRSNVGLAASLFLAALGCALALGRTLEARRQSESARFAMVLEESSDAILFLNSRGIILQASREAENIYGRSLEQLEGSPLQSLEASPRIEKLLAELNFAEPTTTLLETHHRRKEQLVPVELSCRPLLLEGLRCCLVTVRDISERKRLARLDQALRTLSELGRITSVETEAQALAEKVCRAIVDHGGALAADLRLALDDGEAHGQYPSGAIEDECLELESAVDHQAERVGRLRVMVKPDEVHRDEWQELVRALAAELANWTKHKRMEAEKFAVERALHARETSLDLTRRAARVATWSWDLRRERLEASPELWAVTGVKKFDPNLETVVAMIKGAEHRERFLANLAELRAGGRTFSSIYPFRLPDGVRWLELQGERLEDGEQLMGTVRDVTEIVFAQNLQKMLNLRYELALRHSPVVVFEQDRSGRYTWVDHPPAGLSESEVVGSTDLELFGAAGRPLAEAAATVIADHQTTQLEVELPIGEEQHVYDITLVPIQHEGTVVGLIGVAVDITRRVRLLEERRRLTRAIEQSPVAVEITDVEAKIVYVNPAFTEITGYSESEVLGQNPKILKSGETPAEVYRELWQTITAGGTWRGEFCNRRKDGSLIWEAATIGPVQDTSGRTTHYIAVKQDITAARQAAAELEETRRQLQQTQKLEAIGKLAGGIAHDFNNLLTVLLVNLGLLQERLQPSETELLHEMHSACEKARRLTRQLLTFSRRQVLAPQPLDLVQATRSSLQMLRRLLPEDIELNLSLPSSPLYVLVDPTQFELILMNLLVNARDAVSVGGRIEVTLDTRVLESARAWVGGSLAQGEFARLTVHDNGCGIPPAHQQRIFEPFFTTKPETQGTGLGLSTVFGAVEQSGGAIWLRSEVDAFSEFEVLLPRCQAPSTAPQACEKKSARPPHQTGQILVVEDQAPLLQLVKRVLVKLGHSVQAVSSAEEAHVLLEKENFDLLLTDVVLTGQSGPELFEAVREAHPRLKVLFMSGYSDAAVPIDKQRTFFLAKPFTPDELRRALAEALD